MQTAKKTDTKTDRRPETLSFWITACVASSLVSSAWGAPPTIEQLTGQMSRSCASNTTADPTNPKTNLCQATSAAIKDAKVARNVALGHTAVASICSVVCFTQWLGTGPVCKGLSIANAVSSTALEAVHKKDLAGIVQAGTQALTGSAWTTPLIRDQLVSNLSSIFPNKGDKISSALNTEKAEACITAGISGLSAGRKFAQSLSARSLAQESLTRGEQLNPEGASPTWDSSLGGLGSAPPRIEASLPSTQGNGARPAGSDSADPAAEAADPCSGNTTASLFACAVANDQSLPQELLDPRIAEALDKHMGDPNWAANLGEGDAGSALEKLAGLSDAQFGQFARAMQNQVQSPELKKLFESATGPSEKTLAGYQAVDRGPAATTGTELEFGNIEKLMQDVMGGFGARTAEEKARFARELEFLNAKYARNPAQVTEDRRLSIFQRVSFRYRVVQERVAPSGISP